MREPFKHEEALKNARKDVERIGRLMSGEEVPQPTFDAEFETMKRLQRVNFPFAPVAGAKRSDMPVAQPQRTQPQQVRESEGIGY